jgi:hypothetical protein
LQNQAHEPIATTAAHKLQLWWWTTYDSRDSLVASVYMNGG